MTTNVAPNLKPDQTESEERPSLHAVPARTRREDPIPESFDPTQGRTFGSHPYDDPTQGRTIGSHPYDDPTRVRKSIS